MSDYTDELHWEQHMIDQGVHKYLTAVDAVRYQQSKGNWKPIKDESATSYGVSLLKEFILPFEEYIAAYVDTMFAKAGPRDIAAGYLARCDVRTVAYIAAKCIIDTISYEINQTELCFRIAGKLEDQMRFVRFDEDFPRYFKAICQDMQDRGTKDYAHKRKVLTHCHKKAVNNNNETQGNEPMEQWIPWPKSDKMHIGMVLVDLFMRATGMITRGKYRGGGKTTYTIAPTPDARKLIEANIEVFQYMHPEFLPTLIPPKEWTTPEDGGFHTPEMRRRRPLVKMRGYSRKAVMKRLKFAQMQPVYDAVNTAQSVAWKVNQFVMEQVTAELKVKGIGCPAGMDIPCPESPYPLPEKGNLNAVQYEVVRQAHMDSLAAHEQEELATFRAAKRDWIMRDKSNKGKMLGLYNCHKIARLMADKERFYYVHTLDKRGRMYPVGVHLTPQGTDMAKGMLEYADGTALGRWGYWHLCIHAAGVWGNDKVPLTERLKWVHDNQQRILDTWSDPASTREFWGAADKPYMFLAVCKELAEIWMVNSNKVLTIVNKEGTEWYGQSYISHVPCAQDGSCNGIQHFTAMLRDLIGASAVNMRASTEQNKPNDIYGETAQLVVNNLKRDLERGLILDGNEHKAMTDAERYVIHAWLQKLKVDRKVCKKSTMVVPYGGKKPSCVADIGDQLAERLAALDKQGKGLDWDHQRRYLATYVMANYVWDALNTVVIASRKAMAFLVKIGRVSAKAGGATFWTTPLGLPAHHDYKDTKVVTVKTKICGRMEVKYLEPTDEQNEYKMSSAFAPNFVHSMDATHLMMVTNAAADMGIENLALVHDSYGAPAGHCELFHKIIREQFVELYSRDQLYRLVEQQRAQNPDLAHLYPTMDEVEPGDFDIKEVLNAPYFFR